MNRQEFFKRTADILDPDFAEQQHWLIVGLGSGGARVAEETARMGIGRITLVDRPGETLEEHNIARHPLGYSAVGRLKVEAMRERLLDICPDTEVRAVSLDVNQDTQHLDALVDAATLVLLCTDNEPSRHAVNHAAVVKGVPMVFAGVFDGGCGGEVGRALPEEACYGCIATFLNRTIVNSAAAEKPVDYANPANPLGRSTSALNIDIAQIALIQARVALLTSLRHLDPDSDIAGNYILFGNRVVPGLFPRILHSETWDIPRLRGCLMCDGNSAVNSADEAAALLASAVGGSFEEAITHA